MKKTAKKGLRAKSGYLKCSFMTSWAVDMLEQNFQHLWNLPTKKDPMIPVLHKFMAKKFSKIPTPLSKGEKK